MPYIKKQCYVVYGNYKDDPEYPINAEEEICFSKPEALLTAREMCKDFRFEEVTIEEEIRDLYVIKAQIQ